jgi:hypothetical protein
MWGRPFARQSWRDLWVSRRSIHQRNLSLDNLTNRDYYETQNFFESRVTPDAPIVARIHATPKYPLTAIAGITMRFGGKQGETDLRESKGDDDPGRHVP